MPQTISTCPGIKRFQLGAGGVTTRVDLSARAAARVTVQFEGNAGKLAVSGTDAGALAAADYTPVAADSPYTLLIGPDRVTSSVYVESAVASTWVSVVVEAIEGRV